ncbi:unnamed protein product [Amoebophrya sp. A25]|nr:unnamed protein product [Amoebophrya sp. A25]|eukprot:GSA25T00020643001.1
MKQFLLLCGATAVVVSGSAAPAVPVVPSPFVNGEAFLGKPIEEGSGNAVIPKGWADPEDQSGWDYRVLFKTKGGNGADKNFLERDIFEVIDLQASREARTAPGSTGAAGQGVEKQQRQRFLVLRHTVLSPKVVAAIGDFKLVNGQTNTQIPFGSGADIENAIKEESGNGAATLAQTLGKLKKWNLTFPERVANNAANGDPQLSELSLRIGRGRGVSNTVVPVSPSVAGSTPTTTALNVVPNKKSFAELVWDTYSLPLRDEVEGAAGGVNILSWSPTQRGSVVLSHLLVKLELPSTPAPFVASSPTDEPQCVSGKALSIGGVVEWRVEEGKTELSFVKGLDSSATQLSLPRGMRTTRSSATTTRSSTFPLKNIYHPSDVFMLQMADKEQKRLGSVALRPVLLQLVPDQIFPEPALLSSTTSSSGQGQLAQHAQQQAQESATQQHQQGQVSHQQASAVSFSKSSIRVVAYTKSRLAKLSSRANANDPSPYLEPIHLDSLNLPDGVETVLVVQLQADPAFKVPFKRKLGGSTEENDPTIVKMAASFAQLPDLKRPIGFGRSKIYNNDDVVDFDPQQEKLFLRTEEARKNWKTTKPTDTARGSDIEMAFKQVSDSDRWVKSSLHPTMWAFFGVVIFFAFVIAVKERPDCSTEEEEDSDVVDVENEKRTTVSDGFRRFQLLYLLGWYFCMFSDWLNGTVLFEVIVFEYGWSDPSQKRHYFNELMVCGFLTAVLLGMFIGSVADTIGRKAACLTYCVMNGLMALSYFFNSYWILAAGQFANGIATRLLHSTFEAWYVSEHMKRGYSGRRLGSTLGWMYFGSSLSAILAGVVSQGLQNLNGNPSIPNAVGSSGDGDIGSYTGGKPFSHISAHFGGRLNVYAAMLVCLAIGFSIILVGWRTTKDNQGNDQYDGKEDNEKSAKVAAAGDIDDEDEQPLFLQQCSSSGQPRSRESVISVDAGHPLQRTSISSSNNKCLLAAAGGNEKTTGRASAMSVTPKSQDGQEADDKNQPPGVLRSISLAMRHMTITDRRVLLVGGGVALFEASLYIFVCNYCDTFFVVDGYLNIPASDHKFSQPLVFSTLLSGFLIGSCLCNVFVGKGFTVKGMSSGILLLGALGLSFPAICVKVLETQFVEARKLLYLPGTEFDNSKTILTLQLLIFFGFFLFEMAVGMYFPTMGGVKASLVPEEIRATLYNIFYIPCNILICLVLCWHFLSGARLSLFANLSVAIAALGIGFVLMLTFYLLARKNDEQESDAEAEGEEAGLQFVDGEKQNDKYYQLQEDQMLTDESDYQPAGKTRR